MTFSRSGWPVAAVLAGILVAALVVGGLVQVAFGDPWYDAWPQALVLLPLMVVLHLKLRREPGLPLRLTRDHLVLTRPDGPLAIGWDNLAVARVTGRLSPDLVVRPKDPDRTEPVLDRWEWSRLGQHRPTRGRQPYELRISLAGLRPGVARLRTELAARLPATQRPAG